MKIKRLRLEKRIKIISSTVLAAEYNNKIFRLTESGTHFVDWLNGNLTGGLLRPLAGVVFETLPAAHSTGGWNDLNKNVSEYVETLLTARMLIQRGELNYYYENAETYGAPSWFKKRQAEVDLVIRNIIEETPGVIGIRTFNSKLDVNRNYSANTEILCGGGEILWQTIAI